MHKYCRLIQSIKKHFLFGLCSMSLLLSCCKDVNGKENNNGDKYSSGNKIETYLSSWWHLPYTKGKAGDWGRPTYGIIDIDNGELSFRHAILEGRELGDYRLPYWPINSFVSLYHNSLEIAHRGSVEIGNKTIPFRCGDEKYRGNALSNKRIEEGFEVSQYKNADIVKVTNKGSGSQILMEHYFIIQEGSSVIPVYIKATNLTGSAFNNVVVKSLYSQDFNWSSFGIGNSKEGYNKIQAPVSGRTEAFFAFSSGMNSGFEFRVNQGCELSYKLEKDFNTWEVSINSTAQTLDPHKSIIFNYNIKIIDKPLDVLTKHEFLSLEELELLKFNNIIPTEIKTAPINEAERITISDIMNDLEKPKVRGLNRFSDVSKSFDQLSLFKSWGGNLAVVQGSASNVKQIIKKAHDMGIETFIPGQGSFNTGVPTSFREFFSSNPQSFELPDSYGQDEDHHYWYPVKPTLDFESEFRKPMSMATHEEKIKYWSRCFTNKWIMTLEDIRRHHPEGNIFFYMPTPGIANVDPLDYYDLFFNEVSVLGKDLTVLPFYYGTDYSQIEYMVRRWKKSGTPRIVFLPGGPTYLKPSQYFYAITAARRGGADGACGFSFTVTEDDPEEEWRWKSVILASLCNFPTKELDAYCLIEEPAELVEKLSSSEITVYSKELISDNFIEEIDALVPGSVKLITEYNGLPSIKSGELAIIFESDSNFNDKGILKMSDNIVEIQGANDSDLANARSLFLKFAELASVEKNN